MVEGLDYYLHINNKIEIWDVYIILYENENY
jgi:hypothetical protein